MSIELATALYNKIGQIKHLRTFEFLKAINENQGADLWSRITYAQWREKYGIHAFILNECTRECQELGFIEVGRENKDGLAIDGGKGTKRIYKLTLGKIVNTTSNAEPKKENTDPVVESEIISPEVVKQKKNALPATNFLKGKKVKVEKKTSAKKAVIKRAPKKKAPKAKTSTKTKSVPKRSKTK